MANGQAPIAPADRTKQVVAGAICLAVGVGLYNIGLALGAVIPSELQGGDNATGSGDRHGSV